MGREALLCSTWKAQQMSSVLHASHYQSLRRQGLLLTTHQVLTVGKQNLTAACTQRIPSANSHRISFSSGTHGALLLKGICEDSEWSYLLWLPKANNWPNHWFHLTAPYQSSPLKYPSTILFFFILPFSVGRKKHFLTPAPAPQLKHFWPLNASLFICKVNLLPGLLQPTKYRRIILAGWWSSIPDATNSGSKWNATFLAQHWAEEAISKLTKSSHTRGAAAVRSQLPGQPLVFKYILPTGGPVFPPNCFLSTNELTPHSLLFTPKPNKFHCHPASETKVYF